MLVGFSICVLFCAGAASLSPASAGGVPGAGRRDGEKQFGGGYKGQRTHSQRAVYMGERRSQI